MENLKNEFSALFREVSPAVVLVEQVGKTDYYCIGSVILSEGENTFILTQSEITGSDRNLSVRFSNGAKQPARLLVKEDKLCILVTNFYPKCKVVRFFEGDVNHSRAVTIAPASRSSVYNIPGFIVQKSCEAGCYSDTSVIEGSGDYFIFTCQYGETSANRVSRLVSGPIFNLDAQVLGAVVGDMGYYNRPKKDDGTAANDEFYYEMGYFLKIGMRCSKLQATLRTLAGEDDWQNGLKQIALSGK